MIINQNASSQDVRHHTANNSTEQHVHSANHNVHNSRANKSANSDNMEKLIHDAKVVHRNPVTGEPLVSPIQQAHRDSIGLKEEAVDIAAQEQAVVDAGKAFTQHEIDMAAIPTVTRTDAETTAHTQNIMAQVHVAIQGTGSPAESWAELRKYSMDNFNGNERKELQKLFQAGGTHAQQALDFLVGHINGR